MRTVVQRGPEVGRQVLLVVVAHHRDVLGHAEPGLLEREVGTDGHEVVAAQEGGRAAPPPQHLAGQLVAGVGPEVPWQHRHVPWRHTGSAEGGPHADEALGRCPRVRFPGEARDLAVSGGAGAARWRRCPPARSSGRMSRERAGAAIDERVDEHGRHAAEAVDRIDGARADDGVHKGVDPAVEEVGDHLLEDRRVARAVDDQGHAAVASRHVVHPGDGLAGRWLDGDLVGHEPDRPRALGAQSLGVQVGAVAQPPHLALHPRAGGGADADIGTLVDDEGHRRPRDPGGPCHVSHRRVPVPISGALDSLHAVGDCRHR